VSVWTILWFQIRALEKDAPEPRAIMRQGAIIAIPQVGGLHSRYERRAA
jgi:hypothetical protein